MKSKLLNFLIVFVGLFASAETNQSQTQADWFSPDCSSCAKYLTPGTASLGNTKGVYRPNKKTKKPDTTTTAPSSTEQ